MSCYRNGFKLLDTPTDVELEDTLIWLLGKHRIPLPQSLICSALLPVWNSETYAYGTPGEKWRSNIVSRITKTLMLNPAFKAVGTVDNRLDIPVFTLAYRA